ncbi:MAG TPA: fumarylacetoacetate hydrolase family protein [Solirubrobacteraceae bacterium]|jgi:2-keto-4-pentenoate hydratase/2-oxohepta-3-ene-1,7-dioic acid hydratase in catechol pathway
MQIARIVHDGPDGPSPRVVVASDADPNRWIDLRSSEALRLARRGVSRAAALRLAEASVPGSLTATLDTGPLFFEAAHTAIEEAAEETLVPAGVRLIAPIDPPAYRDFMAFEIHFTSAERRNGTPTPPVLYELPVSYMGSVQAMLGPDQEVAWPAYSHKIDFELELGIVIAKTSRNLKPENALASVLGLTVFNDFSARDIQFEEMGGRLGPSKGKHFASAVGPRIVTLDTLDPRDLTMTARVNGEEWTSSSSGTILWPIEELVAWASTGENLAAGTLLGTGTVGNGCGMELGRFLEVGDQVELEISGIGVLRNTIGRDAASDWRPAPKTPRVVASSG